MGQAITGHPLTWRSELDSNPDVLLMMFHRSWQKVSEPLQAKKAAGSASTVLSEPAKKTASPSEGIWGGSTEKVCLSRFIWYKMYIWNICFWAKVHQAMDTKNAAHTQSYSNIYSDIFCSKTNNTNETRCWKEKKRKKSCLLLSQLHMKQFFRWFILLFFSGRSRLSLPADMIVGG